jgi:hypothetical protein
MAKFVCPFCFREYSIKKVLYVCPICKEASMPSTIEKMPFKCKTEGCASLASLRLCSHCGAILPIQILEIPNLLISIVGATLSGKTSYVALMLHEMSKVITMMPLNSESAEHYNYDLKRIYNGELPEATPIDFPLPQMWKIQSYKRKYENSFAEYAFTIYDGSGDAHGNLLAFNSYHNRYIAASKAIILTIDPLFFSKVRCGYAVDQNVMRNSLAGYEGEGKNAEDIVHSVAKYIESARGIKSTQILNIPVAVVLTKFDTILTHKSFAQHALIKSQSRIIRDGKVDITEIQQVDGEIRNWLNEIGEAAFIGALHSHFKEFYFFGVSSYGTPPKDAYTLPDDIRPHRVLDPILWLFKKAKIVD